MAMIFFCRPFPGSRGRQASGVGRYLHIAVLIGAHAHNSLPSIEVGIDDNVSSAVSIRHAVTETINYMQ